MFFDCCRLPLLTIIFLNYGIAANIKCTFNGDSNCLVFPLQTDLTTEDTELQIQRKILVENVAFSYYFKTSSDGKSLQIKGILKWNIQFQEWAKFSFTGFQVKIVEKTGKGESKMYQIRIAEKSKKPYEINNHLETRLELSDALEFGMQYEAQIFVVPFGGKTTSGAVNIPSLDLQRNCSAMKIIAEKWAPHMIIDVYETTSELDISWLAAPKNLCISSYEVVAQNRNGIIFMKKEIQVDSKERIVRSIINNLPKREEIIVKVQAKGSTEGKCACSKCHCIIDKSQPFIIPENEKVELMYPKMNLSSVKLDSAEDRNYENILLIFVAISILLFGLMLYFWPARKNNRKYKTILTSSNSETAEMKAKNYRILLASAIGNEKENDYADRIFYAFKNSDNLVVSDKFSEYSGLVEENILQWTYKEASLADKIVILHTRSQFRRMDVYDILTTMIPLNERKLVHIHLSQESQPAKSEVQYVFPRDKNILEKTFKISIPDETTPKILYFDDAQNNTPLLLTSREEGRSEILENNATVDSGISSSPASIT